MNKPNWFMRFLYWLHRMLFNFLKGFLELSGKIHLPFTHKLITGLCYYAMRGLLKPGTIFVTRIRGELTTLLIPGFWTHAAIYTPAGKSKEQVTEAEGAGVENKDLITFLTSKDYVMVLEPNFLGGQKNSIMRRAAQIATEQLGKPYNYAFDFHLSNQKAFYCSELVWWSYDKACQEAGVQSPFVPRVTLGVPTITPDDIGNAVASGKFMVIWDSRNQPA